MSFMVSLRLAANFYQTGRERIDQVRKKLGTWDRQWSSFGAVRSSFIMWHSRGRYVSLGASSSPVSGLRLAVSRRGAVCRRWQIAMQACGPRWLPSTLRFRFTFAHHLAKSGVAARRYKTSRRVKKGPTEKPHPQASILKVGAHSPIYPASNATITLCMFSKQFPKDSKPPLTQIMLQCLSKATKILHAFVRDQARFYKIQSIEKTYPFWHISSLLLTAILLS